MFNLPFPLALLSLAVRQLLTLCHREISAGHHPDATDTAASNGPSEAECTSRTLDGHTYGPSVLARAMTKPPGDWLQRIRLYREGLATGAWTPNGVAEYCVTRHDDASPDRRKKGTFNYPMTILFGLDDLAFDNMIVLDGIEDYFDPMTITGEQPSRVSGKQSHIIRLPGQGHWFFARMEGAKVLEKALLCLLAGPQDDNSVQGAGPSSLQEAFAKEVELGELKVTTHPEQPDIITYTR